MLTRLFRKPSTKKWLLQIAWVLPVAAIVITAADYHLCMYRLATIGYTGGGVDNGELQAITFHRPILNDIYKNNHYPLSVFNELNLFKGYSKKVFNQFAGVGTDQTFIACSLVFEEDCAHCQKYLGTSAP